MQSLFELLDKKEVVEVKSKYEFEFQLVGDEMQKVFGKKVWPLFYKHPLWKIKEANRICLNKQILSYPYLIGIIKRL